MASGVPLTETVLEVTNPTSFGRGKDVLVFKRGTSEAVQLYQDEALTEPLAQPLITDAGGRPRSPEGALAWVDPQPLDLFIDGQTVPWEAAKASGSVDLSGYQQKSEKGAANGYAGLEAAGKVPIAQLPSAIMEYQGTWNASTNSPVLADGTGNKGDTYRVSAAGERNLGSGAISFEVGDYIIYNGSTWEKSDTTDAVASVAGKKGAVTLGTADIEGLVTALEGKQPLDADLTAIAALATASFGRSVLTQASASAARALLELGSAATQPSSAFDASGAAAAAQSASQPLDTDLTAIAALATTSFGRSVLTQATATAMRALLELGSASTQSSSAFDASGAAAAAQAASQPLDSDLTAIAALSTVTWGRELLTLASAEAARTKLEVGFDEKLFNAKAYGAKGDGSTDDSTAIQNAINAAETNGGTVYFPYGTYIIGTTLTLKAKVHLRGAGFETSIFKLKNSAKTNIVKTANYGAAGIADFSIRELSIDGNKANNTEGSGLLLDGQRFILDSLRIYNCATDGLNAQCTTDGEDIKGGTESFCNNVKVFLCGSRNIRWDIHDGHWTNVVGICKDETSALTNLLIDSNAGALKATNCHAWGQSKYAWEIKASAHLVGCEAEGGVTANVSINGDNITWVGGKVFKDGSAHGKVGFLWQTGKGNNTVIVGVKMSGCEEGDFKFTGEGAASLINDIHSEQASGKTSVTGTPASSVLFGNIKVEGGGTVGKAQTIKRAAPSAGNNLIEGRQDGDEQARVTLTHSGEIELGPGNAARDLFVRRSGEKELRVEGRVDRTERQQELASASTISPAAWADVLVITGTTEVKKITATRAGHVLVVRWSSTAKLVKGENLKIPATIEPTEHDSCIIHCDGTNWYLSAPLQANP